MRFKRTVLTSVVLTGLALGAARLLGADEPGGMGEAQGQGGAGSPGMSRDVSAALRRDLGLSAEQVRKQRALQAKAMKLDRELQDSLGDAFAGSLYDERTGKLIVMVSDAKMLDKVRAAGAEARLVKYTKAELDAIKDELDVAAGTANASGPRDRGAVGKRQALVAGMTSWYVDTEANTVRVTVKDGEADAVKDALAKYGDAVTIEESDLAPRTTSNLMDGDTRAPGSPWRGPG
jgi:streptogrisin C